MKNFGLLSVAIAVAVLAAAVAYHATTGRYEIAPVGNMAAVYRVDTRTGDISICSAAYEQGCMTLEEASLRIARQRENVMNTARQATDAIDEFTREKAQGLRNMLDNLTSDENGSAAP